MRLKSGLRLVLHNLRGLSYSLSDMAPSHSCVLAQAQYTSSQRCCSNRYVTSSTRPASQRRIQPYAVGAGADSFYATGTSFQQLGLSASIADSIQHAGFSDPAQIQAQAIPVVLSGEDVAIASETGSGKTLAYLLPIIHSLKQRQKDQQESRPDTASWFHHCALVLCPNMELCEQVAAAAQSLVTLDSGTPAPLCVARTVSVRNPPQLRTPTDVVVSTPAALCNFLDEAGSSYGPQWELNNFAQCVRHVVADEADALFTSDSFYKPLTRILDNMRASDRAFTARAVSSTTGISVDDFQDLKRGFKMAAFQGGVPAMLEAGWQPAEGSVAVKEDGNVLGLEEKVPSDLWVGKPHRCRSYIFVGATFPRAGGKSVAGDLTKRFPSMQWLEGPQLHASKHGINHEWVRVSGEDRSETIAAVVTALRGQQDRLGHTLVFCRHTAAARIMHEELHMVGIDAALYHKKLPLAARQESLQTLQQQQGGVLVCTDAAARGLDFPSVTHVIQADFADNAVDFLHRIGRTGRADRGGTVTSCYTEEREDLALAIKQAIMDGTPVEGTFSRNRSFSMKMKKHGRFIPRGSTA